MFFFFLSFLIRLRTDRKQRSKKTHHAAFLVDFPDRISDVMHSLVSSTSVDRIVVGEISLDLSLRSSTRLYIALDHSPLKLDHFERNCVLTTPYRFGQTLAMHYVSCALFKAGWVVGSLELLGNLSRDPFNRWITEIIDDFSVGKQDRRLPWRGQ